MTTNKQYAGARHCKPKQTSGAIFMEQARYLGDWYFAWCWRRKMRRLVNLEEFGQVRLGSASERVHAGAGMSLRMIAARQAEWRRSGPADD
ncbi:hypothetical protein D16iCDA_05325 [Pseudomonas seleniipraecipitans]|uniref:Transposase n=1 Tax=Phytopseudomonas seleniipraecipitans TaxID=640205 RepID=A0ABY5JE15_9GAMM|nr:hypothetical protein [Pseudomonas seleniipraecipitans]UUD65097.1 hypothetical protein D16iCDA_05325 [Pseudomonas seleniipraecipitans]